MILILKILLWLLVIGVGLYLLMFLVSLGVGIIVWWKMRKQFKRMFK